MSGNGKSHPFQNGGQPRIGSKHNMGREGTLAEVGCGPIVCAIREADLQAAQA